MNYIRKFFGHLKTILTHKYWVFYYSSHAGIPLQGLLHDLSKFNPIEFFEGVKYWTGIHSPIEDCKAEKGYSMAWLHHKGRNKHHYQYWTDNFDNGGEPILMPFKYSVEMLCDMLGAGRAYYKEDFTFQKELDWWNKKLELNMMIHPINREFLTVVLKKLAGAQLGTEILILDKDNLREIWRGAVRNVDTFTR
jgi:hypothetical protein